LSVVVDTFSAMVLSTDTRPSATMLGTLPTSPANGVHSPLSAFQERPGARWFRRIAGTDIDHAVAFFSEGYDLRSPVVRRTSRHTPWDFSGVGDERMSLRTVRAAVDFRGESRTDDEFHVIWLRSGSTSFSHRGEHVDLQPGVPVVMPIGDTWEMHHRDISLNMVQLDRRFVTALAGDPDFAFEPLQRPTTEGVRVWQDAVRRNSSTWLDRGADLGSVARRDIAESFARAALTAFPRREVWRASVAGTGPEHERLRRALEFVHAHAAEAIGTPEIAMAAGLSPRGLQQSLRRHLDQTPGELLRQVRLDGAHAELRRADRDEVSVAEIARAWGFGHLGRFSAAYRVRFGELPSESLRSRG
jgi:AraC-like DNA-binding protein